MSNTAVEQQNFDEQDPFAGLALVTKPVPKAEPGHVVVRITLRPVHPSDLISISSNRLRIPGVSSNRLLIPGSEGFGIVHEVSNHRVFLQFHAILLGSILALF
jgi:trans-2-enoyl-CoA reductase